MQDLFNTESRELALAKQRLQIAEADPADDRYNLARERSTVAWLQQPSFCAPMREDEINAAHEGNFTFQWDPGRHTQAKNPAQCEVQRYVDLATDRWYREAPASLLKNLGAGFINGIIPGSDLGDARSSTQILGQLIGGAASLAINPSSIISNLTNKMSLGSTLTNAISFVNKTFSGPLGAIGTQVIGGLLAPTPKMPAQVQQQIYSSSQPAALADARPLSYAQQMLFGSTPSTQLSNNLVVDTTKGTISKNSPAAVPMWAWILGALALVGAALAIFLPRKRNRR